MNNAKLLPDAYRQDGNHKKMLELNERARDVFDEATEKELESLDIDKATGPTLDKIGEMVSQKRGGLEDEPYRFMIRFRIAKYLSKGDYNSIMPLIKFMLKSEDGDFVMRDAGNATVEITSFPLYAMIAAGFTAEQVLQLVEELLPAGVGINASNFDGTFELCAIGDDKTDAEWKGFADSDDEELTDGGTLGLLMIKEGTHFELPI